MIHRPRRPADTTRRHGIPVTTPGQTLADLATALPRRPLEKAVEMADARKLHVAIPKDHPGAQRVRDAAARALPVTTDSPLEDAFLELCDAHGIPRPLVQTIVEGYRVDFCWRRQRVIAETDGYEHHGTKAAFGRDRARDAHHTALGWRVVRFTEPQVREEAAFVAGVVRAVVVLAARDAAELHRVSAAAEQPHFAKSVALDSRMTVTLICPGYSSSCSISRAISCDSSTAPSSSSVFGWTMTRISRPACIA